MMEEIKIQDDIPDISDRFWDKFAVGRITVLEESRVVEEAEDDDPSMIIVKRKKYRRKKRVKHGFI